MGEPTTLVHIGARVPETLSGEIEKLAAEMGLDKSDVIRDALRTYIEAARARKCPECGTVNDSDAKFCKGCGHGLDEMSQAELEGLLKELSRDPRKLAQLLKKSKGMDE